MNFQSNTKEYCIHRIETYSLHKDAVFTIKHMVCSETYFVPPLYSIVQKAYVNEPN